MPLSNPANSYRLHLNKRNVERNTTKKKIRDIVINKTAENATHLPCFYLTGLLILAVIATEGEIPNCFLNALLKLNTSAKPVTIDASVTE